jgi:FMN-dependent NADH-azoreductase
MDEKNCVKAARNHQLPQALGVRRLHPSKRLFHLISIHLKDPAMPTLLHIDSSARPGRAGEQPHGSQTRRLTHAFVTRWLAVRPETEVLYRDLGAAPPRPVHHEWIPSAFTPAAVRSPAQRAALKESDAMVRELQDSDIVVLGMPMYNFGMPAPMKAWVDAIVRIALTFDIDPSRPNPYVPLLAEKPRRAVILTSRGGNGFDAGGAMAAMNHADTALRDVLGFVGITDVHTVAVEHEEEGGEVLATQTSKALRQIDALVTQWTASAGERPREVAFAYKRLHPRRLCG